MTRRLPDGTTTKRDKEYLDAWTTITHDFERVMSTDDLTVKVFGYNPDFIFTVRQDGKTWTEMISVPLALRIIEIGRKGE
ncbi:MAG: hypothetical protein WC911_02175 [Thermoleophilia bacterium]